MKILAFTDIHGSYTKVEKIIKSIEADIIIIGGDLTNVGSVREAEEAIMKINSPSKKLLCVAGNMDLPAHEKMYLEMGVSINNRGVVIDNVGFFGVSAAPVSPLRTPYEVEEKIIDEIIQNGYKEIKNANQKILISHAPPYGTSVDIVHSGIHVGSTAVRNFIENENIDLVICGHIHEARGQDTVNDTKIVNCGQASRGYYAKIEINDDIINVYNMEYK